MKTYKLTAKQNAKRRTRARYNHWRHNAPKSYREIFNWEFEAQCKQTLIKIKQGRETEFPVWVKNANYSYW